MVRERVAVDLFLSGCACSQAVLCAFADDFGLDEAQALKLASGFAGGMRTGDTCGAVTGAFMVLGLALADDECCTPERRQVVFDAMASFRARFLERRAAVTCREFLGRDISTPDGLQAAKAQNLFVTTCAGLVRDAASILDEMLPRP